MPIDENRNQAFYGQMADPQFQEVVQVAREWIDRVPYDLLFQSGTIQGACQQDRGSKLSAIRQRAVELRMVGVNDARYGSEFRQKARSQRVAAISQDRMEDGA